MDIVDKPVIYVIALPIGNWDDITLRALKILREVDIVACEDTRMTGKLLAHLQISGKKLVSYHDHSERSKAEPLIAQICAEGLSLGLVSDAGTPCLSDPGYRLLQAAHNRGVRVVPIPGPSSYTALLSVSGLPSDRVLFVGFLPRKRGELEREIASWQQWRGSVVAFESAPRLIATLTCLAALCPDSELCIGRELTKRHEEILQTSVAQALTWAKAHPCLKGELVLMLGKPTAAAEQEAAVQGWTAILAEAEARRNAGATHKDLLQYFAHVSVPRKELYTRLQALFASEII
jgi:16S rRNA (cytidine1402-2'-O)-methyltransferase